MARVAGTRDWRVELRGAGREFAGACDCPAFEDAGFCKHLVAVALTANAAGMDGAPGGPSAIERITGYLRGLSAEALTAILVDAAERDEALFERLDNATLSVEADDDVVAARLRRAIDRATHVDDYVDYRGAADWADGVGAVLDMLEALTKAARAGMAMSMAAEVIERLEEAVESIDDSDGHCGGLMERAADIHFAAADTARPDPRALAAELFGRELDDGYGAFAGAGRRYADLLGEAGLAEYRRLALNAWDELPVRGRPSRGLASGESSYERLIGMLDPLYERENNVAARIALREKSLASAHDYLRLARFCLAEGLADEALRRAEEGLWVFEDERNDDRLAIFVAERLTAAGRIQEALARLRPVFEARPSQDLYHRLGAVGGDAAKAWALALLEAALPSTDATPWHSPADLPVTILMGEGEFERAWAITRQWGTSSAVKEALAGATEDTHPADAARAYGERVESHVAQGGNAAYRAAADLVQRQKRLVPQADYAMYIVGLKDRHGRKRNFMALL